MNKQGLDEQIFSRTPLMYSKPLSDIAGREVYLKLENTQPSGSFKLRGLSRLCQEQVRNGCSRLLGTSGGNAGLALAYASERLGTPCDCYVPETVPPRMLKKLKAYNANVKIIGKDWQDANDAAVEYLKTHPEVGFIHPYDHPVIFEGHSSMVEEIKEDLNGEKPSCIVTSVGGGGLAMGIIHGLEKQEWTDVPLLCMETIGADCFNKSIAAGEIVEVRLTSIAKTLGARTVTPTMWEAQKSLNVLSAVLPDKDAVNGCIRLADDHGFLVEPSCGITLASIYSKVLPKVIEDRGFKTNKGPIVLIVCGGSDMSHEILEDLATRFDLSLKD